MKKIIVTGAGGFIGGALTKLALERGLTVYGVDISEYALERFVENDNFTPVIADFTQYDHLHEVLPEGADVFYHFAWQGVFGEAFRDYRLQLSNAARACDALTAAMKLGCGKCVFAGTMNEYEMDTYISADRFEPRYTYIYSAAKQVSEAVCKTLAHNGGIAYNCGRIAMAFGENNRSMMVPNVVMKNLLEGEPCRLIPGSGLYDMIYIDDIAEAFLAIGERGIDMKSYYVGHRQLRTFQEIIEEIAEILNPNVPLQFGAYPDAPSGVDYSRIDLDALYRDTRFECRADFRESILKTAAWLKSEQEEQQLVPNISGGGLIELHILAFPSACERAVAA